jgi:hypothetical protein
MKIHRLLKLTSIAVLILLFSCNSPSKLFRKGRYDEAIQLAVKRMHKSRLNIKDENALKDAFNMINRTQVEEIRFLQKGSNEDRWENIFKLSSSIKNRQDLIRPMVSRWNIQGINFADMDLLVVDSKEKAVEVIYLRGNENLGFARKGDKQRARNAYDDFNKLLALWPDYMNAIELKNESYGLGINRVEVDAINQTPFLLPNDFKESLTSLFLERDRSFWVQFRSRNGQVQDNSDFLILTKLVSVELQPARLNTKERVEEADIVDGYKAAKDSRGKSILDSAGREIQVPIYRKVSANISKVQQHREGRVRGFLEIKDLRTGSVVLNKPISSFAVFDNKFNSFTGDKRALSDESTKSLGGQPLPMPDDLDMMQRLGVSLRNDISGWMSEFQPLLER